MEKVKLFWKNQTDYDELAQEYGEFYVSNFDKVPAADGSYGNEKPSVQMILSATHEQPISGFSLTFNTSNGNYPTQIVVRTIYFGGENHSVTMNTDGPNVIIRYDGTRVIFSILVVVMKAKIGGTVLNYTGTYCGEVLDIDTEQIRSIDVSQSADISGTSAPYSTMNAAIDVPGFGDVMGKNQPVKVYSSAREYGWFYVNEIEKNEDGTYSIAARSSLGVLADASFNGHATGLNHDGSSEETEDTIYAINEDQFDIDLTPFSSLHHQYTQGFIPKGKSKRDALRDLALAHGMWLDPNCQFHFLDSSSNPLRIEAAQVFARPTLSEASRISDLSFKAWSYSGVSYTSGKKNTQIEYDEGNGFAYVYVFDEVTKHREVAGTAEKIEIEDYLIPKSSPSGEQDDLRDLLWSIFTTNRRIWTGTVLWTGTGNECKLGQRVSVPCADGRRLIGNVIKSDLRFSGASCVANIQVQGEYDGNIEMALPIFFGDLRVTMGMTMEPATYKAFNLDVYLEECGTSAIIITRPSVPFILNMREQLSLAINAKSDTAVRFAWALLITPTLDINAALKNSVRAIINIVNQELTVACLAKLSNSRRFKDAISLPQLNASIRSKIANSSRFNLSVTAQHLMTIGSKNTTPVKFILPITGVSSITALPKVGSSRKYSIVISQTGNVSISAQRDSSARFNLPITGESEIITLLSASPSGKTELDIQNNSAAVTMTATLTRTATVGDYDNMTFESLDEKTLGEMDYIEI